MWREPPRADTVVMSNHEAGPLDGMSQAMTSLVAKAATGVVALRGAPYRTMSGVVLAPDLVASCHHALRRGDAAEGVGSGGEEFKATVIGRVPNLDVAFLKVEGAELTSLPPADLSVMKAGALVAAVGWTLDVGASASLGILGAIGGARRTWRGGSLDHFLRLDISLYPSQTGAAVVDTHGNLIGMATPALSRHSTMAVPIDTLQRLGNEVRTQGRIRHGYVGLVAQTVPIPEALREKAGSKAETGLMVLGVEPDSPAERASLQLGDILLALNGTATADVERLQDLLPSESIGKAMEAQVIRGGEPIAVSITVGERPAAKRREAHKRTGE